MASNTRTQRLVLSIAILAAPTACADSSRDAGAAAAFAERDSAGVSILITPGGEAFSPLGWQVDSVPDLILGEENTPSEGLYGMRGVKALPGGKVLVVDQGSNELRLFDREGQLLRREGGRGRGPGELIGPFLVPSTDTDTVVVFDQFNLRLQVFSADLTGNRTQRFQKWGAGRIPPVGAVGTRLLRERRHFASGTYETELLLKRPIRETRGYIWYDPEAGAVAAMDSFPVVRSFVSDRGAGPLIPFSSKPAATTNRHGALITDGRIFEVRQFDIGGQLRRILRVDHPPRPVTGDILKATVNREIARYSEERRPFYEAQYGDMQIPETQPAFLSLIVDELGWLWAEVYNWNPDEPKEWVVFDPDGRARGTVQMPAGLEVWSITRDHVYGVWRGRFDVEYVHRHRLRRTAR